MTRTHIQRWAPQDWRTSRARARSIVNKDPWLRVVYFEALNALFENGGDLSANAASLEIELGVPREEIERCLPVLAELGEEEGRRGGLIVHGGRLRNRRVGDELAEEESYRAEQSERGKKGGQPAHRGGSQSRGAKIAATFRKLATARQRLAGGRETEADPSESLPRQRQRLYSYAGARAGAPANGPANAATGGGGGSVEGGVQGGDEAPADANGTPPHAASACVILHDSGDPLQVQIAERCAELARQDAAIHDREATEEEVLLVLEAVSTTTRGKHLTSLRGAPRAWLEQTLRDCEAFKADLEAGAAGEEE